MKQFKVKGQKIVIYAEDLRKAKRMYDWLLIDSLFFPKTLDANVELEEIGDSPCVHEKCTIYMNDDFIYVNGQKKKVVSSHEFTYKIMKTQVKVRDIDRLFELLCDKFWFTAVDAFIVNFKK